MSHHSDEDYSGEDDSEFEEEEDPRRISRGGGSAKKRGRSNSETAGRGGKKNKSSASIFVDAEAEVDDDDDEYEDEEEENGTDFFVDGESDLPREDVDHQRQIYQQRFPSRANVEEDVEKFDERYFQERYSTLYAEEHDDNEYEELTEVDQQSLLPSVYDPKLWMVKCAIGREREVAVCLMQKAIDRSDLKIRSVLALDHLQNYIYIEADMEAHVKEAIKGMRNIYVNQKILLVPVKEMTDVVSAESKAIDLTRDTWVRMKVGIYKGDLAQVVGVDNVRSKVTVKLIPRIDLHALANKLEGRETVKKKAFVPPPRFMNIDEARQFGIRVERRHSKGEYFENIDGMLFKDGFLYKNVSTKSITAQNITPTLDELERFKNDEVTDLSTLLANRKKGHFMKGDAVIVIKGDLKNLKGWIEKIDEKNVFIRSTMKGLLNPIAVKERELCKCFEPGNLVKVVCGKHEGATGMVVKVEQNFPIILSDTTNEHIRVFADHVVKSTERSNGVTKIGDYDLKKSAPPRSASRFQRAEMGNNSGGGGRHWGGGREGKKGRDKMVGSYVKVGMGPFKGYRGRLVEVKEKNVGLEIEAKIVTVERKAILETTDDVSTVPSQYNMGSQTPLRPCYL